MKWAQLLFHLLSKSILLFLFLCKIPHLPLCILLPLLLFLRQERWFLSLEPLDKLRFFAFAILWVLLNWRQINLCGVMETSVMGLTRARNLCSMLSPETWHWPLLVAQLVQHLIHGKLWLRVDPLHWYFCVFAVYTINLAIYKLLVCLRVLIYDQKPPIWGLTTLLIFTLVRWNTCLGTLINRLHWFLF